MAKQPEGFEIRSGERVSRVCTLASIRRIAMIHARRVGKFDENYDAILAWDGKAAKFDGVEIVPYVVPA